LGASVDIIELEFPPPIAAAGLVEEIDLRSVIITFIWLFEDEWVYWT
jgi:hypothetical protein